MGKRKFSVIFADVNGKLHFQRPIKDLFTPNGSGNHEEKIEYSRFSKTRHFLPNHGRFLPALTFNGYDPLNVNAGRILSGFSGKR